MEDTICEIDWHAIRVSPFQPRRHFSEEELEELAASITSVGLIHPPVVRAVLGGTKVLYYELIVGERRWRAAQKAGLSKIKVIVRHTTDEQAAKSALIENVQRVNLDPIEMAEAFKRLIDIFRMAQHEVAEKVGKKRSTVANYLRLLNLSEEIKTSVSTGTLTMGHAKAILSLDDPQLRQQLSQVIITKQLTVREAEKESRRCLRHKTKEAPPTHLQETAIEECAEKLQQHFGTKVEIEQTKKGGKISLYYYSLEDLERVLSMCGVSV